MKLLSPLFGWLIQEKNRFVQSAQAEEEFANLISHALGVIFGVVGGTWLLYLAFHQPSTSCFLAVAIYIFSLILVYASSTLYHIFHAHPRKRLFRMLDHISIYFLIAGSYTPFLVCYMNVTMGRIYLGLIWGMVILGTVYKFLFMGRYRWFSVVLYLFMGWVSVFNLPQFLELIPGITLLWILIGGLFYTLGVVFYMWKKLRYNHFIWHLFVLGGSLSHFVAVYFCVDSLL